MRVAVTGANGFIGRAVCAQLSARAIPFVACVRSSCIVQVPAGCEVVRLDIHEPPNNVYAAMKHPDVLIHLAWGGLPNYRSLHHFEQELPAHFAFLRSAIEEGLQHLLVVGTCFEYGMQSGQLSECMDTRPVTPYGFAKDALRRQLEFLQQKHPFNLTWARLFYLYGEGQAESSLFSQLCNAVTRGDSTFDMSGGEQLRDYLPVSEAARLLVALALKRQNIGVVNVCSGEPISVRRLVENWLQDNGWRIKLNLGRYPYPDYEPMAFWGDRRRLDRLLRKES